MSESFVIRSVTAIIFNNEKTYSDCIKLFIVTIIYSDVCKMSEWVGGWVDG